MCFELLAPVLGLFGALAGPKPEDPPAPVIPATPADAARQAGATVRVGDGQNDDTSKTVGVSNVTVPETRLFGKPVGGLGKSGLTI